jgi:hypothetical protein
VLGDAETSLLYESWRGRGYAADSLLYKLYTHAAAFRNAAAVAVAAQRMWRGLSPLPVA